MTSNPTDAPTITQDTGSNVTTDPVSDGQETGMRSACSRDIPEEAVKVVQDQVITFDYVLNLVPGYDVGDAIQFVQEVLHNELVADYLEADCNVVDDSDSTAEGFRLHAFNSLPNDQVSAETCSSNDADCYIVNASFTTTFFYLASKRFRSLQAQSTITDSDVFDFFSAALQSVFENGNLTAENSEILGLMFETITNGDNDIEHGNDKDSLVESEQQNSQLISSGALVGVVVGMCALIIALVVALFVFRRQREAKKRVDDETRPNALEITTDDGEEGSEISDKARMLGPDDEDTSSFVAGYPAPLEQDLGWSFRRLSTIFEISSISPSLASEERTQADTQKEDPSLDLKASIQQDLGIPQNSPSARDRQKNRISDTIEL